MGCGWELIDEVKDKVRQHRCENRHCRYDAWANIDKWAFRSKAWQVNYLCSLQSVFTLLIGTGMQLQVYQLDRDPQTERQEVHQHSSKDS
jgi:hypothetical protein